MRYESWLKRQIREAKKNQILPIDEYNEKYPTFEPRYAKVIEFIKAHDDFPIKSNAYSTVRAAFADATEDVINAFNASWGHYIGDKFNRRADKGE